MARTLVSFESLTPTWCDNMNKTSPSQSWRTPPIHIVQKLCQPNWYVVCMQISLNHPNFGPIVDRVQIEISWRRNSNHLISTLGPLSSDTQLQLSLLKFCDYLISLNKLSHWIQSIFFHQWPPDYGCKFTLARALSWILAKNKSNYLLLALVMNLNTRVWPTVLLKWFLD